MGDNGGVHAQNGFALQRNTAIFLLLGNYAEKFKDKKYFIYLEHHEDFLFCFLNENEQVNEIEAYQSKKSSQKWTLNKKFYEDILTKLLQTGLKLRADSISKTDTYGHSLYFSSNQTIELKEKNGNTSIDETNTLLKYKDLSNEIRDKLKKNIPSEVLTELENLGFIFIDLPKKPDEQENQLAGKFDKIFGKEINDKRAALSTIITLFRKIETTFNQGGKAELSDKSKRVSNQEIENAFEILTTKSKCFNYWRDKKVDISKILKIRIQDRETFELAFESAFD
jgi:L-rhamnose mutarotase